MKSPRDFQEMPSDAYELTLLDDSHSNDPEVAVSTSRQASDGDKTSLPQVGEQDANFAMGGENELRRLVGVCWSGRAALAKAKDDNGPIALIKSKLNNTAIHLILQKYDRALSEEARRALTVHISKKRKIRRGALLAKPPS
ncbi:hypothetical protein GH714_030853 [Hevea brasiliensis]|uniref:Uncharacterized protein n=1 Tax=Hevea brasiliensis TaxID=3981 RepID=A0A6A6LQQ8_HEVBR|nr:hypothetical protein GH714_030853 [Hevea brasiliensis]